MLFELEPHHPHNSEEAWEKLFNQPPVVPEHVNKKLGEKEHFLEFLASQTVFDEDSYVQSLARKTETQIIYISQEWELGREASYLAATEIVPDSEAAGSGLVREDVVELMTEYKHGSVIEDAHRKSAQRDSKIAGRKKAAYFL